VLSCADANTNLLRASETSSGNAPCPLAILETSLDDSADSRRKQEIVRWFLFGEVRRAVDNGRAGWTTLR
jgi:hypothetical protein